MPTSIAQAEGTSATSNTVTASFSGVTAAEITASRGVIAILSRRAGSGSMGPSSVPAGWTKLNPNDNTSGSTGIWFFYRRGDGTFNSLTLSFSTTANNSLALALYENIKEATFVENFSLNLSGSNRTSVPFTALSSTEDYACVVGAVSHGGTAGGTGFVVPATAIRRTGGSQFSGYTWYEEALDVSGDTGGGAVSWTTSSVAAGGILVVKTEPVITDPPPVIGLSLDKYYDIDITGSTGETSYAITHTSGPNNSAGIITVSPGVWRVPKDVDNSAIYTVSAIGTGGTTTAQVTVPPSGAATAGIRTRVWDGTKWSD